MLVKVNISMFFIIFIIRGQLNPYIEDVLSRIQDLLVLNTPDNGYQHLLSNEDQLFIYETAGSLIVSSSLSPEVSGCLNSVRYSVYALHSSFLKLNNVILYLDLQCKHSFYEVSNLFYYEDSMENYSKVHYFFRQRKHHLMKELLSPIASKFESLLSKLQGETDEKRQYAYAQSINMATSLARYMISVESEVNQ